MSHKSTPGRNPVLLYLSFGLALLGYAILVFGILFRGAIQPISATLLWLLLDALAAWTAYSEGGNYLLAAGYTVGCLVAALATLYVGKISFQKSDFWIAGLVVACVMMWYGAGNLAGLVASSLAVFIAGLPALILYWRRPQDGLMSVWAIYTIANAVGLYGGWLKGTTLENLVFPLFAVSGSLIGMILIARKYLPGYARQSK
jgi:hypothetical protein